MPHLPRRQLFNARGPPGSPTAAAAAAAAAAALAAASATASDSADQGAEPQQPAQQRQAPVGSSGSSGLGNSGAYAGIADYHLAYTSGAEEGGGLMAMMMRGGLLGVEHKAVLRGKAAWAVDMAMHASRRWDLRLRRPVAPQQAPHHPPASTPGVRLIDGRQMPRCSPKDASRLAYGVSSWGMIWVLEGMEGREGAHDLRTITPSTACAVLRWQAPSLSW